MRKPADVGELATEATTGRAFARIGLLGNPSDAYRGKAVALSFYEFSARVRLEPTASEGHFGVPDGLAHGLIAASCARYAEHASLNPDHAGFEIAVESNIPFQVGLAGSSAIVIACLRALISAFGHPLDAYELSEMALAVEVDDLEIAAGPMDRAIQAYEGALLMDFGPERSASAYTRLARRDLPHLLIAWDTEGGEASGRVHSDVRERWQRGDADVHNAMREFAELVDEGMAALRIRDLVTFRAVVDRNFDARCALFPVSLRDREMVKIARGSGAAAKLCGSGGAVVAVLADRSEAAGLAERFADAGYPSRVPGGPPAGFAQP